MRAAARRLASAWHRDENPQMSPADTLAMLRTGRFASLLAVALMCLPAQAQDFGESVVIGEPAEQDLYLFGASIEVLAPVRGDVVAAGGEVRLSAQVSGDVNAAGGLLTLAGPVLDDARLAGGRVRVGGQIGGDLIAAGRHLALAPDTAVAGRTWLAGDAIEISGVLDGELRASGRRVSISGEVHGDARITAEALELLPGARIHGVLHYRSPQQARIDSEADINRVEREPAAPPAGPGTARTGVRLVAVLSLATTGLVLFLLFPARATAAVRHVRLAPWASLGIGLAVLAATPLVVALLTISVLGVWLGLILLASYLTALVAGFLLGALAVGDAGLRVVGRGNAGKAARAGALVIAVAGLWLIGFLPWVGAWVPFAVLLAGLGALGLQAHAAYVRAAGPGSGGDRPNPMNPEPLTRKPPPA